MIAQKEDVSTGVVGSTGDSAPDRLLRAYNRLHKNHRVLARRDFCEYFGITDDSFRAKRSGQEGYPVTQEEIDWLESYTPQIVRS